MLRLSSVVGLGILMLALVVGVGISGDTKKDAGDVKKDKETTTKKPMLPQGWKALKLTAEQKKTVYSVMSEYRLKIEGLRKQIADLEAQERAAMLKVLTDDQKALLLKGLTGESTKEKVDKDKK